MIDTHQHTYQQSDGKISVEWVLRQWDSFVRSISGQDRVAIIHDVDPDGLASAVILAKMVSRLRGKDVDLFIQRERECYGVSERMLGKLRRGKITRIFTVDIAFDQNPHNLDLLGSVAPVVLIDHHELYPTHSSDRILVIKPQLIFPEVDPAMYSTSKLSYDLAARVCRVDDMGWIAALGIIGDNGASVWEPFLRGVCGAPRTTNWYRSAVGQVAHLIVCNEAYNTRNVPLCLNILYHAEHPSDVLRSPLRKYKAVVHGELQKYVRAATHCGQQCVIFEIKPRYHVKSALSTLLARVMKERTFIVADVGRNTVIMSARSSVFPVNDLLKQGTVGLKGASAGGHAGAAAARFRHEDYPLVKQRIMNALHIKRTEELHKLL